jgi:transaldolase
MSAKNKLQSLKRLTTIVADTGEIDAIRKHKPQDATTNPSLLFKAAQMEQYQDLIKDAFTWANSTAKNSKDVINKTVIKLFVNFGLEILKIVPGRVSTEVDARLSFDIEGSIARAHEYIALYEEAGIGRERVLIKLASTWEGIQAAKRLEKEGIHCNMTLMFGLAQAIAAAEAGATLISPFVGRIFDWQKAHLGIQEIAADQDMGVQSVTKIFDYYKKFGYKTQIMGASFRNVGEILELAGCDLLTIAPNYLEELESLEGEVVKKLDAEKAKKLHLEKIVVDEKTFRWMLCDDQMASDKLDDGIRNFAKDTIKLEKYLTDHYLGSSHPPQSKAM